MAAVAGLIRDQLEVVDRLDLLEVQVLTELPDRLDQVEQQGQLERPGPLDHQEYLIFVLHIL